MNVNDRLVNNEAHSIEWGDATWDEDDFSIRNRYDNVETGRFNKAGSSEVPWEDFNLMVNQSIVRGHFTNAQISEILTSIANRLNQQQ